MKYTANTTKLKEASYYVFNRNPEGGEVGSSLLLDFIRLLDYIYGMKHTHFSD